MKNRSVFKTMRLLAAYFKPYRAWVATGLVFTVCDSFAITLVPFILKIFVDATEAGMRMYGEIDWHFVRLCISGILLGTLIRCLFQYAKRRILISVSRHIEADLRARLFRHLQCLTPAFYTRTKTGEIMSTATADMEAVRMLTGPAMMQITYVFFSSAFILTALFWIDPWLTTAVMVPMVVLTFSMTQLYRRLSRLSKEVQERMADLSVTAQENFAGVRVVRTFTQETAEIQKFSDKCERYQGAFLKSVLTEGAFHTVMAVFGGVLLVTILYVGGNRVIDGKISKGDLIAFITYQVHLMWPLIATGWLLGLLQRGIAGMNRIQDLLDEYPEVSNRLDAVREARLHGGIEIRDLTFRYGPALPDVLKNVSLSVKPGQKVALVGKTGAGKTTLAALLLRMYPVPDGHIFLDGTDINRLSLHTVRSQIGYVPQDAFLFSSTIRENIAYADPDSLTQEELNRYSSIAQMDSEIQSFTERYEQMLGERGVTLSGGQKQRATIARALAKKPAVLILDDSLSSVDTNTEEKILRNLDESTRGLTRLVIAHRISTVKDADLILVIDGHGIAERGNHSELVARNGIYARMHRMQLLSDEIEKM